MQRPTQSRCRRVLSVLAALTLHAAVLYGLRQSIHPAPVSLDGPVSILLVPQHKAQGMIETVPPRSSPTPHLIAAPDPAPDAAPPRKPQRKSRPPGAAAQKTRPTPVPAHSTDPETVRHDPENLLPAFNDQSIDPSQTPEIAHDTPVESSVKNDPIDQNYLNTIMTLLEKLKKYPEISRKRREEGIVTVIFTVERSGKIIVHDLYQTSGHSRLDDAALRLLEQTPSLPAIPASYRKDVLTLILPIRFKIET